MHFGLIVINQNKKTKIRTTIPFENAIYRVIHERSNNTAPFVKRLKLQEI